MNIKLNNGYELRKTIEKGEGIFATKCFKAGETVMTGRIEKKLYKNHSHASQTGENEYVLHAGSITKVNHSCHPDCGIQLNETGAHNFVAMKDIKVNEELEKQYAYTPMEKYEKLKEKNPHIDLLRKTFDLDI